MAGGDHNFLSDAEVGCLRPGGILSLAMVQRLSTRIYEDAVSSHGISSQDFYLAPPIHLTRDSSSMRLKNIEELYPLTCERSHHPHILIPSLVKRHWLLAVVKPAVPVGEFMVLSSRSASCMYTSGFDGCPRLGDAGTDYQGILRGRRAEEGYGSGGHEGCHESAVGRGARLEGEG